MLLLPLIFAVLTIGMLAVTGEKADFVKSSLKKENHFRMARLNGLWGKALKILTDENELLDLYGDFAVQDNIEFKRKREEAKDDDEIIRNFLDKRLLAILLKHGLGRICPENIFVFSSKELHKFDEFYFEAIQKDPKLSSLWEQANDIGFNEEEMKALKSNFMGYLDNYAEYIKLKKEMKQYHESNLLPHIENNLSSKLNEDLKKAHKEMKLIFDEIQLKLSDKISRRSNVMGDYRILQLWQQALKQNLSESELSLFKDELNQFSERLLKYNHFLKRTSIVKLQRQSSKQFYDTWLSLDEKTQSMAKTVKKWHHELKTKLSKRTQHTEL